MLSSEKKFLNAQLTLLAETIDRQLSVIHEDAMKLGIKAVDMKYADGSYILPPLLVAMSQTLNAKVHLNKE